MDIRQIDLNLLVTLDALLTERNVSRAAVRLNRSQPAVSASLARLRGLLGDPLLVRQGTTMAPTPFATSLETSIAGLLREIERVLVPSAFHPTTSSQTFKIAVTDYTSFTLFPKLIRQIRTEAPQVRVELWQLDDNVRERLAARELDLAVADDWSLRHLPHREELYAERFTCVVRRDHPRIGRHLTLSRFLDEDHLLVSPRGRVAGNVDLALEQSGQDRHVAVTLPHFLAVPFIVGETDLIVTLAERVARRLARVAALRVLKPPLEVPGFSVSMAWNSTTDSDPAIGWLKQQITAARP